MGTIVIAGHPYEIPDRYEPGHVLNEREAAVLNQTYRENIGNNFRKRVKEADDPAALQEEVAKYAESYEFGLRVGGGGAVARRDPVDAEAHKIARERVIATLKKNGKKASEYSKEQLEAAIGKMLDLFPDIYDTAREVVEKRRVEAEAGLEALFEGAAPAGAPRKAKKAA